MYLYATYFSGDAYGSIQHITDEVPPVIMADQSGQNQVCISHSITEISL